MASIPRLGVRSKDYEVWLRVAGIAHVQVLVGPQC